MSVITARRLLSPCAPRRNLSLSILYFVRHDAFNGGSEGPRRLSTVATSSHDVRRIRQNNAKQFHAGQVRRRASTKAETASSSSYHYVSLNKTTLPNDSGVHATVTICNPVKLNIVNSDTINELQQIFESLTNDENVRAIVLTGQADPSRTASFCAGANIREMESINNSGQAQAFITKIYGLCEAIYQSPAITIARIDGLCFGAGLELAACCDFRFGTERSTFSMKEVAVGIPSVVHARLLANIIGWQAAKRMVLLGRVVEAQEAHSTNLLDHMFPTAEEMDEKIEEDTHTIASYGRKAMRSQKELNKIWERTGCHEGIYAGIDVFGRMWDDGGSEPKRYMRAWMQRSRDKK